MKSVFDLNWNETVFTQTPQWTRPEYWVAVAVRSMFCAHARSVVFAKIDLDLNAGNYRLITIDDKTWLLLIYPPTYHYCCSTGQVPSANM
ncbi:uncharacterized protein PG986_011882 [Apiospora aurea]|uniref:Uncharacterized protein n=1 Tax=Apiospora aurea TaxID=335848 RepID=A0ABR1PYD9_9PEZI